MTNASKITLTLSMDMVLTNEILKKIKRNGFSRIPIIEENDPNRVIGVLLAKSCLGVDVDSGKTILQLYRMREIEIKIPLYLPKECTLHRIV
jgi:CBS domain containing-hemolysin-like protein